MSSLCVYHFISTVVSVSIRLFSQPPYVAVFASPIIYPPPQSGGRLGPHYFLDPSLGVNCRAHFCATATSSLGLGLILSFLGLYLGLRGLSEAPEAPEAPQRPLRGPAWVSIWASEALQTPQRPQRPLRGPSEAPLGSQLGPQRLGSQFELGIGIIKMPSVAE